MNLLLKLCDSEDKQNEKMFPLFMFLTECLQSDIQAISPAIWNSMFMPAGEDRKHPFRSWGAVVLLSSLSTHRDLHVRVGEILRSSSWERDIAVGNRGR